MVQFSNTTGTLTATAGATVATGTATIQGSSFISGDKVGLTFYNSGFAGFPVTLSYTLGAGESATSIAAALNTLINANASLIAAKLTSTVAAGIITISQAIGNETVAFSSINLSGGTGTYGAFTGTPTAYTGQGSLPSPNSVCFQDGYFFFTTGGGQCYATQINGLSMNALTFINAQAKADVNLLRGVAFSGFLLLFTTGSCEVWQDAANPAPNFPYARIAVLEFGLIQAAAIAGFETGFSELLWVAQDFGVYWMSAASLSQVKASPPDLDRLIEAQIRAGNTLEAGCYVVAGKKFWQLSCPDWTWEFNLQTKKWLERQSLNTAGQYGRWRATGGHPAFGKWLCGDELSGNLLWIDSANYTENGAILLYRLESGPVIDFPQQLRIARADFEFDMGVGIAVGTFAMKVSGAASGTNGATRLTVDSTVLANTNDVCSVAGVGGTTEANGTWPITVIDATHIELIGSAYVHAYTSGGVATDLTSPPNAVAPVVAISMSKDGGLSWGNPLIRALGPQGKALRQRASVKHMGLSGAMGDKWRLDITDPVYRGFMGGTQSSDPREVGV